MEQPTPQLFVYGSLRSGFRNPAYEYLTRHFTLVGEAVVRGRFYHNGEFPIAVPTKADNFLTGELYQLTSPHEFPWVFEQLDDYEGLNVMPGEIPLYKREMVPVFQNARESLAWIYWYNRPVSGMEEIPTGDIMQYLQQKDRPGQS
ncbi:MAG: gamma-glutamylcyclotransferase [Bacteroidetes bacterium]|nr:gamma-glutamylcyclotransferase [Bacteroidota bacterium]